MHQQHRPTHLYIDNAFYFISGAIFKHFKLLNTDERKKIFIQQLKKSLLFYKFVLYAWVVLDNHYHLIIKVSSGSDLPKFIAKLHRHTALLLNKIDNTPNRKVFYQYWDYCLRQPKNDPYVDLYTHINYLHINPLKHKIISENKLSDINNLLKNYKFSSFNKFLDKYGEDGLNDLWRRYPINIAFDFDDFD